MFAIQGLSHKVGIRVKVKNEFVCVVAMLSLQACGNLVALSNFAINCVIKLHCSASRPACSNQNITGKGHWQMG